MQFNAVLLWRLPEPSVSLICWMKKPEVDDGYVTLVNAKEENGKLMESEETYRTLGMEAYHIRHDGNNRLCRVER